MTWTFVLLLAAVLFGPVLVKRAFPAKPRHWDGVRLHELEYQEITFQNRAQNLTLSGLLIVPEGDGPFPAVVVIHGSGTSRRKSLWYTTLSGHLQKNGVAVLLADKRGSEKSGGNWQTSSFEDLATDTAAAVEYLREQNSVAVSKIGVVGMSQGGWIAPVAASKTPDISFVVNFVGPAVTTHEQFAYEVNNSLLGVGFLPGVSDAVAHATTFALREVFKRDFWKAVGNFDPLPYWRGVGVPTLVLHGSQDMNLPTEESRRRFEALGKENLTVRVYEGSGHGLEDPVGRGDDYIRREALADISAFIGSLK